MIKGQIFEIEITDMTDEGAGIGKVDGFPLFVKDTVIGDRAKVMVIKDKKTYAYARLLEVVVPSPMRVMPACEIARPCGGCQLQAMSYEATLRFKENKVRNALERLGGVRFGIDTVASDGEVANSGVDEEVNAASEGTADEDRASFLPIIGMDEPWHYRNKAEYPVRCNRDGKIVTGFYAGRTHSVIECDSCKIGQEHDATILAAVKEWMIENSVSAYDEESGTGVVRHVMIRTSHANDSVMVCLIVNAKKLPAEEAFVKKMMEVHGVVIASLSYSINTEMSNVIMGREVVTLRGNDYLEDSIGDVTYHISPQSFYQVNPAQTEKLYEAALNFAGLGGEETVWDLYCGIGTISLFLAKKAKKVYGVEIVPAAVENAKANAELNGIGNAEFFCGAAEDVLPEFYRGRGSVCDAEENAEGGLADTVGTKDEVGVEVKALHPDVIVVDPPRKGCDARLLDTIMKMAPEKVVYVSCNPATLARDVKVLCGDGAYLVEKVQAVDMFPWTGHVETVVLMSRVKP